MDGFLLYWKKSFYFKRFKLIQDYLPPSEADKIDFSFIREITCSCFIWLNWIQTFNLKFPIIWRNVISNKS